VIPWRDRGKREKHEARRRLQDGGGGPCSAGGATTTCAPPTLCRRRTRPRTASTLEVLSSSPSGGSLGDPSSSALRCIGLEVRLFGSRSQGTLRHPFEVLRWRRNPAPDCAEIEHLKRRAWRRASCPKKTC